MAVFGDQPVEVVAGRGRMTFGIVAIPQDLVRSGCPHFVDQGPDQTTVQTEYLEPGLALLGQGEFDGRARIEGIRSRRFQRELVRRVVAASGLVLDDVERDRDREIRIAVIAAEDDERGFVITDFQIIGIQGDLQIELAAAGDDTGDRIDQDPRGGVGPRLFLVGGAILVSGHRNLNLKDQAHLTGIGQFEGRLDFFAFDNAGFQFGGRDRRQGLAQIGDRRQGDSVG